MTDRELMQMALDALNLVTDLTTHDDELYEAIDAISARLTQPEPDDGYCQACDGNNCTAKDGCVARDNPPPQREWQGLTDEEMMMIYGQSHEGKKYSLGRAIEAKLKEKNT